MPTTCSRLWSSNGSGFLSALGQRARRLLEHRVPGWEGGKTGDLLDKADVEIVEKGASGMRSWTPDEMRLDCGKSRKEGACSRPRRPSSLRILSEAKERKEQAEESARKQAERHLLEQQRANLRLRRAAYALAGMLALAIVAAGAAIYQWREAKNANTERAKAHG